MAKKNVPGVVSAMGALLSIIVSLVKFVNDLGGDVGELFYALALPTGESKLRQIAEVIVAGEKPSRWTVWRTIVLGTGIKTGAEFKGVLKVLGCQIGGYADKMLDSIKFTVNPTPKLVRLVVVSVAELGFPNGATLRDIYETAILQGLAFLPSEAGVQLRMQYYSDQPAGEWLRVAMEPIEVGSGLYVWYVDRDGDGRWLFDYYGDPVSFWYGDYRFVFAIAE